jgi:tRNA-dihydrouridine synthase
MAPFWDRLKRPFFVLAPLADVTDAAFRRVIAKYGKPDALWTEFVSADGLAFAPEEGRKKLLADLMYTEAERPIVAQFFSGNPESMEKAAALAAELGFDGIDINMGCPDKSIERQHAGAAIIKEPERAKQVIAAAIRGAGGLPVSVKTRLGYNTDELDTWLPVLLGTGVAAISIHLRTRKEMSKVAAHWERATDAVRMRDRENPGVLILANGDVESVSHAKKLADETGVDGVMLGRAIFGNPWLFSNGGFHPDAAARHKNPASDATIIYDSGVGEGRWFERLDSRRPLAERLLVLVEHTKLFAELLPHKNFAIMKKHYKAYVKGFDGAADLRTELMEAPDADSVAAIVHRYLGVAKNPSMV